MKNETDQEVVDRLEREIKELQKHVALIKRWGKLSARKEWVKG